MSNFIPKKISPSIIDDMVDKNIWSNDCPVHFNRLSIIELSYIDFAGITHHNGQIIVLDIIAEHVSAIFKDIYRLKFPLAKISLINFYNGDDNSSMNDNNSHCFNFRKIASSDQISLHSYGVAIDINPLQNPYLTFNSPGIINVYPTEGKNYINRSNLRPGMVEPIVRIFKKYGFVWGGDWNSPIDLHHFQLKRELTEQLLSMPKDHATSFFNNLYPLLN